LMRRARVLDPEAPHDVLVTGYALLGEDAQAQREIAAIRPLLDADNVLVLRAKTDLLAGRAAAAGELLEQALTADPPSELLLLEADEFGLTVAQDSARRAVDRLHVVDPNFGQARTTIFYPAICTLAWSGDHEGATAMLASWEPRLRRQMAYTMATGIQNRGTWLARGLACTGRSEEAIVELEKLIAEGYHAGGSRGLVADHAFDAIRHDPRFEALITQLRSVEDAERQRYLARPDLEDRDIEALAQSASR